MVGVGVLVLLFEVDFVEVMVVIVGVGDLVDELVYCPQLLV